jgi:hypothetical protein
MTRVGLLLPCAALAACTSSLWRPGDAQAPEIQRFEVSQLTESTWTAIALAPRKGASPMADGTQRLLLREIEKRSGCKVTDVDLAQQGRQFDAQVLCDGPDAPPAQ